MVEQRGAHLVFHNQKKIDGILMKRLINRFIEHFGMAYTSHILDQVKTLGFQQATATSISLGIDDLLTIPSKGWLVQDAEKQSFSLENHHHYGNIHALEKLRQSIEIWYATSEYLRQEMNPNFKMTDPLNPVHIMSFSGARGNASQVHQLVGMRGLMLDPHGQMIDLTIQSNLREGLSVTEYIISCYGARKGVVDTAVRTSDAGYLTRRFVEVVQHMVVRRTDCGTIRGISVSPRKGMPEINFIQTLMGRVLADDIYRGQRCIATRNQDVGIGLVYRFITFRVQSISIRTPFTCRGSSWICRLCYGRSATHGDLVDVGEAVGILAGQSIGEPGTQLTLRTFHTGGVFTGATEENVVVRASSNGKIKFNEDWVHPTRTRHGYPSFLCYIDLYVHIESEEEMIQNVKIPPKSFILVQNDQYVKSEQAIAEIRAGTSTLNLKERVRKHIYSDSEGEMHWSTDVYHAPEFTYGDVHLLPKTSHLWIFSRGPSKVDFFLYKDQDQMVSSCCSVEPRSISNLSVTNDQVRHKLFRSDFSGKNEEDRTDYSAELNRVICTNRCNLIYPVILHKNSDFLAKKRQNRFIIPFQSILEGEKELIHRSGILIDIPINGIFCRKTIISYFDHPRNKIKSSGMTNGIEAHSIVKKEYFQIEFRGVQKFSPKCQMNKVDRFFFIPEEVHFLPGSSSIMVRNNSLIGVDTRIALNTISRSGGWVRVERKKKIALKIFSGEIHFPGKTDKICHHSGILILPSRMKNYKEFKKLKNWIYLQQITPTKTKNFFVLVRPVVTYAIADGINLATHFPQDLLRERDHVQLQGVNYYLFGKKQPMMGGMYGTSLPFLRTCLVMNWDQEKKSSSKEAYASFAEVRTKNGLIQDFLLLRINLAKEPLVSYTGKKNHPSGSEWISDNGSGRTNINPFDSKPRIQEWLSQQNQGTIRTLLLNRNIKECQSLIILSSSDCYRMGPFVGIKKYHNAIKESSINSIIPIRDLLGPFGIHLVVVHFYYSSFRYSSLITHNQTLVTNYLQLDNLKQSFQGLIKYFVIDENGIFYNPDPCSHIILNPFHFNCYFLHQNDCEETSIFFYCLGQFLCENICITKNRPLLQSGQVLIVQVHSLVIRSAKSYLATPGSTVRGHYGSILYEGNTLVTFLYEKLKSGDITQGLTKIEHVLEVCSIDSISKNLESRVECWNERITRIIGNPWLFLIGAELTLVQSRISLVNKIQTIYRSQGVQIHTKHIEMIVRQITSKVLVSEDGMSHVFSPGEQIGLLRAERTGRALEEVICYRMIFLGITRTSLNTQSFISEASFQETTRVLAKASIQGRVDWLKGLKENVVLGRMIPVGTGFKKGIVHRSRKQHRNIFLETKNRKNLFGVEMRSFFLPQRII